MDHTGEAARSFGFSVRLHTLADAFRRSEAALLAALEAFQHSVADARSHHATDSAHSMQS